MPAKAAHGLVRALDPHPGHGLPARGVQQQLAGRRRGGRPSPRPRARCAPAAGRVRASPAPRPTGRAAEEEPAGARQASTRAPCSRSAGSGRGSQSGGRAQHVLVVDEELGQVDDRVHRLEPGRRPRRRPGADALDQLGPAAGGVAVLHPLGPPRQRRHEQPDGGVRAAAHGSPGARPGRGCARRRTASARPGRPPRTCRPGRTARGVRARSWRHPRRPYPVRRGRGPGGRRVRAWPEPGGWRSGAVRAPSAWMHRTPGRCTGASPGARAGAPSAVHRARPPHPPEATPWRPRPLPPCRRGLHVVGSGHPPAAALVRARRRRQRRLRRDDGRPGLGASARSPTRSSRRPSPPRQVERRPAAGGAGLVLPRSSVLNVVGVVVRRVAAGVTCTTSARRTAARSPGSTSGCPLSWHHRHPTGQLLSNANADVEATWQVFAPLPMALGRRRHAGRRGACDVPRRPGAGGRRAAGVPGAVPGSTLAFQRRMSPLVTRAQQLRAEVSERGARELRRRRWSSRRWAGRTQEAAPLRRRRPAGCGTPTSRSAGLRGIFDPVIEALPDPRHPRGPRRRHRPGRRRRRSPPATSSRSPTCSRSLAFPVRAIGWVLGELPRTVVGWDASRRRAATRAVACTYGDATLPGSGRPPAGRRYATCSDVHLRLPTPPAATGRRRDPEGGERFPCCTRHPRRPARPDRGRGRARPAPASPRWRRCWSAWSTRTPGRSLLDGVDLRVAAPRRGGPRRPPWCRSRRSSSTTPIRGNVTLGAPDDRRRGRLGALRLAQADGFVAGPARRAATPGSASAASPCPAVSGSGLALARAVVRRPRLLVLDDATSRRRPAASRRRSWPACAGAGRGHHRGRRRLPDGDDRAGRRGGLRRARAGGRPRAARASCSVADEGYRRLVTAYAREDGRARRLSRPPTTATGEVVGMTRPA